MSEASNYKALLSFALGPVQPFIAAARRTQDLFVGSKILSYLASIARDKLANGDNLIYPPADAGTANIPNKLLAEFSDVAAAERAGKAAVEAVDKEWRTIAALVYAYLTDLMSSSNVELNEKMWNGQVNNALELYYAALDPAALANLPGSYDWAIESQRVEAAESLLAVRKLVRDFTQYGKEQCGPMSSIGGERPALRATTTPPTSHQVKQFWLKVGEQLHKRFEQNHRGPAAAVLNLEGKEQLDAISLIKRFLNEAIEWGINNKNEHQALADRLRIVFWGGNKHQPQYPSTSDVAAADLRAGIIERHAELSTELDSYASALSSIGVNRQREGDIPDLVELAKGMKKEHSDALLCYDGDLLFGQNISVKMLQDDYGVEEQKDSVKQLVASAGVLLKAARKLGVYCTSPYYAVVVMDGDRMGAMLRRPGANHRELSKALADFARADVPRIAEQDGKLGRVIYAGGEDVLAVFPLTKVLPAILALMQAYRERVMATLGTKDRKTDDLGNPLATISAGIAIAHHLTPLDFVLAQARAAEKDAKNKFNRNAVAVYTLRRSGEHTTAGYQFGFAPQTGAVDYDALKVINTLVGYIAADQLSSRLVYDFAGEAHALPSTEMAEAELKRLLFRHASKESGLKGDRELSEQGKSLLAALVKMHEVMNQASAQDERSEDEVKDNASQRLTGWLRVAEFIARGGTED